MTHPALTRCALRATLLLAPLAGLANTPTPADIRTYNGAAYGAFPVEYTVTPTGPAAQANNFKLFGEYTLGDIDGDLDFMLGQNITKVKTYAHVIWSPVTNYTQGLQQYIERWNTINTDPTAPAALTALEDLNNPFESWSGIPSGTKWIIPQAAAKHVNVYATANVINGTIASTPANMPATVDIKIRVNGVVQTVTVTPVNTSLPGGYTSYTSAHWDVELAIASAANDRLQLTQPANSGGSYGIAKLSGNNREYVQCLIIGNEVLSTGALTVTQVKDMVTFAKQRRDAYGLSVNDLPVTTSTNSLGNWRDTAMATDVLPLIEKFIFFNTYGMPFESVSGTNQAGVTGLSTSNPGQSVGNNVIANIQAFKTWLAGTAYPGLVIHVGEHGYPTGTAASDPNDLYNTTHANAYYQGKDAYNGIFYDIAAEGDVVAFFFEIFNEPWKDTVFPTTGTENNWGIATASQETRRFPSNQFDPGTYDVWTYPESRSMKANFATPVLPANSADTDNDGLNDAIEDKVIGIDINDAITDYSHVSPSDDYDGDGLNELGEQNAGTDPTLADSDNDLFLDGDEVAFGSDPNSADSLPVTQVLSTALEFTFNTYNGLTYQVEYTEDFGTWNPIGDPVAGDGTDHSIFISFEGRSKNREQYRLGITQTPPP